MTSAINDTFLTTINEAYPVAGVNNSSEGFRTNFARIKEGLGTAGKELTYLQDKRIEVVGDATGISGILGNSLTQPAPINLVLAATGVTAGTYETLNKTMTLTVDAKGRITSLATADVPTRPSVVGEFKAAASVVTTYGGNTREMTVPALTFDEYGTLTVANNTASTLKFGLEGHVLAKGNLIVGHETDGARAFALPQISFNPLEMYVLTWRPAAGNSWGVEWRKIPDAPPINPAQVISVVAGEGITVSTDPANPIVEFDLTKFPEFPTGQAIAAGSKVVLWDAGTNAEYKMDVSRLSTTPVMTFKVKDDPAPELGGDLTLGAKKIVGNKINGIVLDTRDAGPLIIRNTQTIDPNFYNPNNPDGSVPLPEDQWVIKDQKFPLKPPVFTPAEITAGTNNAFMKIDVNGQMYWDKTAIGASGVQQIDPGVGVRFDPMGSITTTGTINLDFSAEPIQSPDIFSDYLVAMDANNELYRNSISAFTFSMPKVAAVDPVYGSDTPRPGRGQLNQPFRTIAAAIFNIPVGSPDLNQILLLPGVYEESMFMINRPNVQIISMMGPEMTIVRTHFQISDGMGKTVIKGVNFDISNLTDPAIQRIMTADLGLQNLAVENCWFTQDDTDYGRARPIIRLQGTQRGQVHFNNCKFNGIFENNLVFDDFGGFQDGRVRITNTVSDISNVLTIVTGPDSLTEVAGAYLIKQAIHNGGSLEIKNVSGVVGDWSDALWDSIDPETDDLESMGFPKDGIRSTANYMANNMNYLALTNVVMRYPSEQRYQVPTTIQKTGTCNYVFSNVDRLPNVDTVNGNREIYGGAPGVDAMETTKTVTLTGSYDANVSVSRTWDMTLNSNTTVSISEDSYSIDGIPAFAGSYANSVTILVRQGTGGSNTITFSAPGGILWSEVGGQPPAATGAGKVSVFTFLRVGATWVGARSFIQA
ncbi:hypothetical protein D3C72_255050 [compost metagenome]